NALPYHVRPPRHTPTSLCAWGRSSLSHAGATREQTAFHTGDVQPTYMGERRSATPFRRGRRRPMLRWPLAVNAARGPDGRPSHYSARRADVSKARVPASSGVAATAADKTTRGLVTIMIADLSGSTPLGERLDPEEL